MGRRGGGVTGQLGQLQGKEVGSQKERKDIVTMKGRGQLQGKEGDS